ncbi:hypothetical protein [Chryseobacterium sp. Marseille-Q3244]|uniref:hypothetical protein n=1 Tax=Chryseobacterium sp. Marseille-Q3244 TaxID=2758092 RepID=UPI00202500B3|nr:hypothetical protein [Chryseobacterium sp. Marseille-Q3244]
MIIRIDWIRADRAPAETCILHHNTTARASQKINEKIYSFKTMGFVIGRLEEWVYKKLETVEGTVSNK